MPALSLGDFKKGNIFFTLIVVIAVCVLLFIPDLIGINTESILDRSTVSTSNTFEEMVPEQEQQDEIIPAAVPALPNEEAPDETLPISLVDIQRLLDSDYLDELVQDKRAERQLSKLNETSRAQPRKEYFEDDARFSLGLPKLFNNDPSQNQIQAPDELTWKFLQSKPIKRRFAGMHVDATSIAASVPDRYQVTKYAMYDYATTVKAMADGSQRFESPLEAIEYIRHLDRKVLSSIREEGVSREVAVRWSKISLEPIMGPIFEQQREQLIPDFDPKLAIIDMAIETQEPKNIPNSSVDLRMLKVKFRLKGSELVSVQALVHENLKPFYYFMPNTNEDVRTASFSYLPLEGPITFEVKDRFGYTARYTYDFTPLLRAGTWRKSENTGLYELRVPSKIFEGRGFENFLKGSKAKSDPNGLFVQSGPLPYVVF